MTKPTDEEIVKEQMLLQLLKVMRAVIYELRDYKIVKTTEDVIRGNDGKRITTTYSIQRK